MKKVRTMNKEMLDYNKSLLANLDENAKWLRAELKEIGVPGEDKLFLLKQYAHEISSAVRDLEGLILRGEY